MTIALPVAAGKKLVGTSVLVKTNAKFHLFATVLHLFGTSNEVFVVVPPHGGNCSQVQPYPMPEIPMLPAKVVLTDPLADLAILAVDVSNTNGAQGKVTAPIIVSKPYAVSVGAQLVALGYPFAPIGSVLETWTPTYATALAARIIGPNMAVEEIVLSMTAHPGSSGSAVVGRDDGILYGLVRGALAPPDVVRIGDIPIATDTSVTYATSAHLLHDLIAAAERLLGGAI